MNSVFQFYTKTFSARTLKKASKKAEAAIELSKSLELLTDEELSDRFQGLKSVEASERAIPGMALVREAARRSLGKQHYPVQLLGGQVLLSRNIAQMRTGEGKTLTITVPAALRALEGKGVHIVTANEYLATRDAELMKPVYNLLGLSVGVTTSNLSKQEKAAAYACDITYGVGSEFGFDYLKDNLARQSSERVQRPLFSAIVDEVDSILIDEARVPLIIAEEAADQAEMVRALDKAVSQLEPELHFITNLKERSADLTEEGYLRVEKLLTEMGYFQQPSDLYMAANLQWVRRLHSAVKARALYRRNRDYVVKDGSVDLVDPGTGRTMAGRRLEDGLHEALEAREGLPIKRGTVIRATITYQSYFGLYENLSGLTGTASTDTEEFSQLYELEVVIVPTNKPVIRTEHEDLVFLTKREKFQKAVDLAKAASSKGQPVLLGCASIRDAEYLDSLLSSAGIEHETLTAKHVAREAQIIAQAGEPGAVTVATHMAGRGTDIILGGESPEPADFPDTETFELAQQEWARRRAEAMSAGGLFVISTERNGLRRVDNQLAGRSGRQGDPGEVQFLLSLEDELLKVFGSGRQYEMLVATLSKEKGSALGGAAVGGLITAAQETVEGQGFAARKSLMKFDQVLADQRNAVYSLRQSILDGEALGWIREYSTRAVHNWTDSNLANTEPEQWNLALLKKELLDQFGLELPLLRWATVDELSSDAIVEKVHAAAQARLGELELDEEQARKVALEVLDESWSEHLGVLKELQDNAGIKTAPGLNAGLMFHKEAFEVFKSFTQGLEFRIAALVMPSAALQVRQEAAAALAKEREALREAEAAVQAVLAQRWVGRNEKCPCGSGKRFKDCHGAL